MEISTQRCLQNLKTEPPYDPVISLLCIYLKKTKILTEKDICICMFTAALFITPNSWKQPKCPSLDEWIKKMWCVWVCVCIYIYNKILVSLKKEGNLSSETTWIDLDGKMLKTINQKEKDKYCTISYMV